MSICCILVKHKLICLNYNDVLRQKAEGTLGKWEEPRVCAFISTSYVCFMFCEYFSDGLSFNLCNKQRSRKMDQSENGHELLITKI